MTREIKQISVAEAQTRLASRSAIFLDIRDSASYESDHIEGAVHLSDANLQTFLQSADKNKPTIVYCYHGISSQGAAQFFQEQGFVDVFSMTGGFAGWRGHE